MDTQTNDRMELLKRFQSVRERKRECLKELEQSMKNDYENRTGKKANYFFAL